VVFDERTAGSAVDALVALVARVEALIDVGRTHEARALLAPPLAGNPDDARLWWADARAARNGGDPASALASARRGAALAPEWSPILGELALALAGTGQGNEAVAVALHLVALRPDGIWSHLVATVALRRAGRAEEALLAAQTYIRLDPRNPHAHETAGRACMEARRWADAEPYLRHALELEPGRWSAVQGLADVLRHRRRRREALALYALAMRLEPDDTYSATQFKALGAAIRDGVIFLVWVLIAAVTAMVCGLLSLAGFGDVTEAVASVAFLAALAVGFVMRRTGWLVNRYLRPGVHRAVSEIEHTEARQRNQASGRALLGLLGICILVVVGISLIPDSTGARLLSGAATLLLLALAVACVAAAVVVHRRRPLPADLMVRRRDEMGAKPSIIALVGGWVMALAALLFAAVAATSANPNDWILVVLLALPALFCLFAGVYGLVQLRAARATIARQEALRGR
jgi:tetratricopeptide (TPR) repeat protein